MFDKFIYFIKYNNATILIGVLLFIFGAAAFASEPGREFVGDEEKNIVGVDNKLLLEADLDNFDMDFKIEKIEEDKDKYYVSYNFLDLVLENNAWQYQLVEKIKPISKKMDKDLGDYLADEFKEEYEAKIQNLKKEKELAIASGAEKRVEVTSYSGLIGKTLDLTAKVFPNYEPVKKKELNSPEPVTLRKDKEENITVPSDNMEEVYNDFITENDPDLDNIFGLQDNCPDIYNSDQADANGNGVGDICDSDTSGEPQDENKESDATDQKIEVIDLIQPDINMIAEPEPDPELNQ